MPSPAALESVNGGDVQRRLWYARQGAALVYAADVAAVVRVSEAALFEARAAALEALYAQVSEREDCAALVHVVTPWMERWRAVRLEELFSVLWRARWPVARFFPRRVHDVVDPGVSQ